MATGDVSSELPGACAVSDACDELGIDAARTGSLRPLWPECPAVAGPLTTVRLEAAPAAPEPLPELLEVLAAARSRLVLIDLGGSTERQCWGSVLATAAQYFGVAGALVNGAVRDVDDVRRLGFPTYARGVYPVTIRGRLRVRAVDEAVDLDGAVVEPGCFAVADSSGVVFLPAARQEDVLVLARRREAAELEQFRAVRAGADPRTVFL
jgi:4-hydroxy-4-methyl-2-oxoglutarate aldolase